MTKYTYEVYKDVKDYQKDLLEFLTENKQAGQSIENEINKLRNKTPGYEDIEWAHSETDDIVVEHQHQDSWNYCPSKNIFVHKITINGENNAN